MKSAGGQATNDLVSRQLVPALGALVELDAFNRNPCSLNDVNAYEPSARRRNSIDT